MANKKNKKSKIYIILILIISMIIVFINMKKDKQEILQEEKTAEEQENEMNTLAVQQMEERDRMEYYFGIFLEYVENQRYENAYNLLNEDFKQNYFPTIDLFKEYISNIFTEMSDIEHENIERNGDVYVLWIYVTDALNGKPGEKKKMNFVIKENDYNNFELSFSVQE